MGWVCEACGSRDAPSTPLRRLTCAGCREVRRRKRQRLRVQSERLKRRAGRLRAEATERVGRLRRRVADLRLLGWRVLLADDEPMVRDATRLILEDAGARVATAGDGVEALDLAARRPFHVVLCDLRMPRLDGFGLLRRLRQHSARAAMPVVAVSAFTDSAEHRRVREAGFDGQLAKPFGREDLFAALLAARRRQAA